MKGRDGGGGGGGGEGKGSPPGDPGLETHSAGGLRQHKDGGGLGGEALTLGLRGAEGGGGGGGGHGGGG